MAKFTGMEVCEIEVEDSSVVEYVAENYRPEEVFPKTELQDWALDNGFVEEDA